MPRLNNRCPVVARCEPRRPHQLAGYEMHRLRTQKKNKEHCDPDRRHLNTMLIGQADWLKNALARIELMREENFAEKLAAQKRQSRLKDMRATIRKGPEDPWEKSEGGPLREIILTAHHQWFAGANSPEEAKLMAERQAAETIARGKTGNGSAAGTSGTSALNAREAAFEDAAVAWLNDRFGGAVLQARSDRDELGYHIHAIVMVTKEKMSARRGKQVTIQPSENEYIKDYELLQKDAGKAFAAVGLKRGKRTKQARKEMAKRGKELPPKARHVHPREHQKAEDLRLTAERCRLDAHKAALARKTETVEKRGAEVTEREAGVADREAEADAILAVAEGVASGEIEPPRDGESASRLRLSKKSAILPPIRKAPKAAKRALVAFGRAFGRMRDSAETDATARWAERNAALDVARDAIAQIRKGLLAALPQSLRKKLGNDLEEDDRRLAASLVKLSRLDIKGQEQSE